MNKNTRINSIALALLLIATAVFNLGVAQSQEGKIVPYVPTPQEVVDRMLELAQVKKGDVVYDLGSGDGRIVVSAAQKYGVRAIGFEIDPERIKESTENIKKAGVGHLVEIRQQDIRTVDLAPASVLTMYLLPEVNLLIRPNIWKQMKPGSRIVSHDFDMGDWKYERFFELGSHPLPVACPGRAKATRAIADLRTIANGGSMSLLCSAYELAHGLLLQPNGLGWSTTGNHQRNG